MATSSKQGLALAGCNYVAQDQIWKSHVHQEQTAARNWPENWNFMTKKYEDLVKDDFPRRQKSDVIPPTPSRPRAVTPLEQRVNVRPSPNPVPVRTSGEIGWRSTAKECQLEIYGKYAKPKGALLKQLNWPSEAVN